VIVSLALKAALLLSLFFICSVHHIFLIQLGSSFFYFSPTPLGIRIGLISILMLLLIFQLAAAVVPAERARARACALPNITNKTQNNNVYFVYVFF